MEKPSRCINANVPMMEMGTATSGMMEARQVCRNSTTTITTSTTASSSVWITAAMEARTNCVVS